MPAVFHRRTASSSSAATTSSSPPAKPPSIFRYTLILLKARPSISDIDTLSVYSESRTTPPSPTAQTTLRDYFLDVHTELRGDARVETPPPPYEHEVLPGYVEDAGQGA
ncbi:hypothetical protein PMIN06_002627 [Paraphaeosphaeria minitans]|uniref:Uncharacterized protein n=1 Tax=Paraphaeosphaeria minitans TaxID=565426 RepID=A0A9P6KM30_9PLEO|nr:hypothetical protein PMIN01_10057 [Paraphaeosphaeria minitans]